MSKNTKLAAEAEEAVLRRIRKNAEEGKPVSEEDMRVVSGTLRRRENSKTRVRTAIANAAGNIGKAIVLVGAYFLGTSMSYSMDETHGSPVKAVQAASKDCLNFFTRLK